MPSTNGHGPKQAIHYARVSTDEQAKSDYSLAQQMEALREYTAREGYEVLSVTGMNERELDRLQAAIDCRRGFLKKKLSIVLERREYRNGLLQLEGRAYRRKKDDELTERGPYWYFHYREGGKQRTLYVGKTDNSEAKVNEIMEGE